MTYETIEVRRLTGGCGAEISGVDLANLSNRQWQEVRDAFVAHGVVFFRNQTLSPEQHIAFARRWGAIDINRFFTPVAGYPEIAEVRKEKEQKNNIGGGWHTDHSYDVAPAMGSILLAREVPEEGGDTLFASMYAAYETLSEGLRHTLDPDRPPAVARLHAPRVAARSPGRRVRFASPRKIGRHGLPALV